jgi:hypothetical protein
MPRAPITSSERAIEIRLLDLSQAARFFYWWCGQVSDKTCSSSTIRDRYHGENTVSVRNKREHDGTNCRKQSHHAAGHRASHVTDQPMYLAELTRLAARHAKALIYYFSLTQVKCPLDGAGRKQARGPVVPAQ